MRSAIVLAAVLVLAGCVSPKEPVDAAEAEVAPMAADTIADGAAVAAADPTTTALRQFPFSFDGKVGYWACIPNGPDSCQGSPAGTDSENTFVPLEHEGNVSALTITLTWSATTPATQRMYISVMAVSSCGDGCFEVTPDSWGTYVDGQSPLTLDAPNLGLREGETLYLHVGTVDPTPSTPSPVMAFYSLEQAFSVEGAVTALVPATPV